MASMADVCEILDVQPTSGSSNLDRSFKTKEKKTTPVRAKRPEGMSVELWRLLWTDNRDSMPVMPTETGPAGGYKQTKVRIVSGPVRPWRWTPFTISSRPDGASFYHWRHTTDDPAVDYPFAKFNKKVDLPHFSELEYKRHLQSTEWTRNETDHLLELAAQFDLRFPLMVDRWDHERFTRSRTIEDLKERYYFIMNTLGRLRAASKSEFKPYVFDAQTERNRKEQLNRLLSRTQEQVEEEEKLLQELKKIESNRKDRERKAQEVNKYIGEMDELGLEGDLLSAASTEAHPSLAMRSASSQSGSASASALGVGAVLSGGAHRAPGSSLQPRSASELGAAAGAPKGVRAAGPASAQAASSSGALKRSARPPLSSTRGSVSAETGDLGSALPARFGDANTKQPGASKRSDRLKITSIATKKASALDDSLKELGIVSTPMAMEDIVTQYNELRNECLVLMDLRGLASAVEFELQNLRQTYKCLNPEGASLLEEESIVAATASASDSDGVPMDVDNLQSTVSYS